MEKTVADHLSKTALTLNNDKIIKVLHVDDDENSLSITKLHLEKIGSFQVDSVLSVRFAYEKLKQKHYDVIISDYIMPDRNGLEFLKQLRNEQNNIPFVLFTGTNRNEVLIDALY
jgi:CheY-like chemotaxis protein